MSVHDGPGEGTWSVHAARMQEERDAERVTTQYLRAALEELKGRYRAIEAELAETKTLLYECEMGEDL